jgi:hypothetical protein
MLDLFLKIQKDKQIPFYKKKEILRVKEAILDYFFGENRFKLDKDWIEKYF